MMKQLLKEAISSSEMNFDDLMSFRQQNGIFLLPSAFYEHKRGDSIVTPSSDEGTSLVAWYNHASIVWDSLTKFGHAITKPSMSCVFTKR